MAANDGPIGWWEWVWVWTGLVVAGVVSVTLPRFWLAVFMWTLLLVWLLGVVAGLCFGRTRRLTDTWPALALALIAMLWMALSEGRWYAP